MFRSIGCGLFCVVLCVGAAPTQDKKEEAKKDEGKPKFKLEYLEKTWGLKFKSAKLESNGWNILLTFTKDVEKVDEMREALKPPKNTLFPETGKTIWYLFDADDVVIGKTWAGTMGELTGKEGDAFWIAVINIKGIENKVAKIEPRNNPNVKDDPFEKKKKGSR